MSWWRALPLPGLGQLRVHVLTMRVGSGAILLSHVLQLFVPGSSFQLRGDCICVKKCEIRPKLRREQHLIIFLLKNK